MEIENKEANEELINEAFQDIINLLRVSSSGIPQSKLFENLKQHKQQFLVEALNILFEENKLMIENSKSEGPLLKILTEKEVLKLKDLSPEEHRVYEIIMSSGDNGISLNELKNKIGITGTALQKIRKKLEKKLLIKNITIPNMKNKKVILGYDIEPSNELKGGFWCTNQQFDQTLIDVISNKCIDYLIMQKNTGASRKEILLYIKSTGLVNSDIKEDDLQKVLNILVFDDKIDLCNCENLVIDTGSKYSLLLKKSDPLLNLLKYKVNIEYFEQFTAIENTPCSFCPVFQECNLNNIITPEKCPHLLNLSDELF